MKTRERRKLMRVIVDAYKERVPPVLTDLSKQLGVSESTVRQYKSMLVKEGLIVDPIRFNANASLPEFLLNKSNFMKIDSVSHFIEKCELDKIDYQPMINSLYRICCAVNVNPNDLLINLDTTEKYYSKFEKFWMESRPQETTERYRKAIRKFCHYGPFEIPKRNKVIPGTSDSKGDYSNVYLSDEEITKAYKFMEEKGHDWQILFALNHEMFPRPDTMYKWTNNIKIEYVDVDNETYPFGTSRVYEEKQKKYYDKLIIDPRALRLSKDVKPGAQIITHLTKDQWEETYSKYLKELYYELGKIEAGKTYPKGIDQWLYFNRPIYTIRHSSAMLWMQRTSFNTGLVSKMGWEDPKTLDKYYARSTVANIMQMGICWWHNPPKQRMGRALFCSPMHALAYYTREFKNLV